MAVAWQAQGEARAPRGQADAKADNWLHLHAQASLLSTCQRCLQPVLLALDISRAFRFVEGEEAAAAQDEEANEDVLALEPKMNLLALVEDELLMALPMVALHDTCPELPAALAPQKEEQVATKPNPFAALASLKLR